MGDLFPRQILDNEDYGEDYMRKLSHLDTWPGVYVVMLYKAYERPYNPASNLA